MHLLSKPMKVDRRSADAAAGDGWLVEISHLPPRDACAKMESTLEGISAAEAAVRLKKVGPNLVAREHKPTIVEEIWRRARNPLNALLLTLAAFSYFLGDVRAAIVISTMVVLAITTAFVQEHRSNEAAAIRLIRRRVKVMGI